MASGWDAFPFLAAPSSDRLEWCDVTRESLLAILESRRARIGSLTVWAVSVTILTINYASLVTRWLSPWVWFDATVARFLIFIGLFLILIFPVVLV